MALDKYLNMVRINYAIVSNFKDIWDIVKAFIRFAINDYIPGIDPKFELKPNFYDKFEDMKNLKGIKFDPVSIQPSDFEKEVVVNLVASFKNVRDNIPENKKDETISSLKNKMERDSFRSEMELHMNFAFCYPNYPLIVDSPFYRIVKEYIEGYLNKFDVVEDIKYYLPLFGLNESHHLRTFVREKLDEEEAYYLNDPEQPPNAKLIRWRIVHFKLNKVLGAFDHLDNKGKLELVNTIMQTYLWARGIIKSLEFNDRVNLDDIIIVAAELLMTVKIWEWSVLNPINFQLLAMLEYALKKSGIG